MTKQTKLAKDVEPGDCVMLDKIGEVVEVTIIGRSITASSVMLSWGRGWTSCKAEQQLVLAN